MKYLKWSISLLAVIGICALYGCTCDGYNQEPQLWIEYNTGGSVTRVYATKDGKDLEDVVGATGTSFNLPIDLNANSVNYTIEATDGSGTLVVKYTTNQEVYDGDCGYLFYIENAEIGPGTSYGNVSTSGGDFGSTYQIEIR